MDADARPTAAEMLLEAYEAYVADFHAITRRAGPRFEARDWTGALHDGLDRLRLYKRHIDGVAERCEARWGALTRRPEFWDEAKETCWARVTARYDADLALMFVDSVMRRSVTPETFVPYGSDGVDPKLDPAVAEGLVRTYTPEDGGLAATVERILRDAGLGAPFHDLASDAALGAEAIAEAVGATNGGPALERIEMLRPLFYRNKGAYLVGRLHAGGRLLPLAFALVHSRAGISVDAVLTDESDLRRLFSYTRSNFHVELQGQYRELLDFLHSLMPRKNWAALYSSIGFMNPAKIQLSKDLDAHRHKPGTRLCAAWGIPGLVMVVFTSPGFPYVYKVIRDDDKVSKAGYVGREGVRARYRLVQEGDRVGRLLDTITFHHLRFHRDDFEPKVLRELLETCSTSVKTLGDHIVIKHCYAQREATPLPIYLHQNDWPEIHRVLNDLGWCLKNMTAAGLFPGEFDLKNFGVAEDGRVVFFDFDGLDELRRFSFDEVPLEASLGQEESFEYLLHAYRVSLVDVFRGLHPDLFTSDYWRRIQRLLKEGEVLDTFPYPATRRLEYRRRLSASRTGPLALPTGVEEELDRLGLRSAHRRGRIAWESLGRGLAVGRGSVEDLSRDQRLAVQETFGVSESGLAHLRLGVVLVDEVPAFVCLPEASRRVLDLSGQYTVERAVVTEWRERVQRELFPDSPVDFHVLLPRRTPA
jgi:isocitrate dehydrogenase kinase/phosphatase